MPEGERSDKLFLPGNLGYNSGMFETTRRLWHLLTNSHKIWLIPIILLLILIGILVVGAQVAPLPIFLYPLI
jgi:hypothetical protein